MGEYASNSKGNTGVALGATGLGLAAANILGNGGLGNLFGGIFGNGNNSAMSSLMAENSMLKAQKYSAMGDSEVFKHTLEHDKDLRREMFSNVNPLIQAVHDNAVTVARLDEHIKCNNEKEELQRKLLDQKIDTQSALLAGKINEASMALNGKINTTAAELGGRIDSSNAALNGKIDVNIATIKGTFDTLNQTIACIAGKIDEVTTTAVKYCKICPRPMPAAMTTPPQGTTWYPSCTNPLAAEAPE